MTTEPEPWTPVLIDPQVDARLQARGIAAVPLLDAADVTRLQQAYWARVPPEESGIQLDYLRPDRSLVRELASVFDPVWDRVIPEVFRDLYPIYSSFVVKHPGADSDLFLHRDLPVVDERDGPSFALWVALDDTSPDLDNGPLAVVPGSEQIRHGSFGPTSAVLFNPYRDHLRSLLEPWSVPAGGALVYDTGMLHASEPNRSDRPRLAVGCLMARRHRPVVQVVATGRRHRELVAVDRDYFLDLLPGTVTVEGMPARYKVVDDYDEEPAVTAYELLGPLAIDAPAPVTDVPLDLAGGSLDRTPLPELPSIGYPSHTRDLAVRAGDLCEVGANIGPLEIRDQSGSAGGFIDLVMANRFSVEVPPSVPDVIADLRSPDTAHAALVVLDARSRLTGCAMADGVEIIVIECSPTKAGMALPDGVAAFELGTRHALPNDEQVSIWNDGPGPLVLLLRHLVDLPQAVPRWRAALGSLRRRLVRDG